MIQVNIFEQLETFFNILRTNQYFNILIITALVSLLILLLANKFQHKKITKIIFSIVYIGIFATLIYFYHKEILSLLDYLMNNIFLFLFFPNLAVYILVLIIINVLIIKSTFSKKDNKVIKGINIIFFLLFQIIFYLIVDNVVKNSIDVYEQLSIYTNQELLILIELSMQLFLLWLGLLVIGKVTSNIVFHISLKKSTNNNLILENTINDKELINAKSISDFREFQPELEIKDEVVSEILPHSIYNDFIDIEPIKKDNKNLIDLPIKSLEIQEPIIEPVLDITPSYQEEKEITAPLNQINSNPKLYQGHSFENFEIIEDFQNDYGKIDDTNKDMDIIFKEDNNYLKNIIFDINQLKNNQGDKDKLKNIYENIKLSQKDLTLNDYNNLINMLLELKK